jgi:hypothetical protein
MMSDPDEWRYQQKRWWFLICAGWWSIPGWAFVVELWRFVSSDMAMLSAEYESYTRGVLLASPELNVEYIYIRK